jgi:hypothetical protein
MRAHTEGKVREGKRFATVIGMAAAGVMALGAQTALAGGSPATAPRRISSSRGRRSRTPRRRDPYATGVSAT